MDYSRRYVQFNNLVFDTMDIIEDSSYSTSFKFTSHELTHGNGNYAPFKRSFLFAEQGSVSLTVKVDLLKLPCEDRPYFRRFMIGEMNKPGKLWAVQNDELIWAYAVVTGHSPADTSLTEALAFSIDFTLPEGVWHKADSQKTFLKPYDPCTFMECYDYKDLEPCKNTTPGECCYNCTEEKSAFCNCCWCNDLCKDYALCYNKDLLQNVYKNCSEMFQIDYNCGKGQEFFGDDYLGEKFCNGGCRSIIAANFYADTDIPTSGFNLIIHGATKNPMIDLNGNQIVIKGEYQDADDPILTLKDNGDVYFRDGDCCDDTLVPAENIEIQAGSEFMNYVYPGNNRLIVDLGMCCGTSCIYVQVDGLTV